MEKSEKLWSIPQIMLGACFAGLLGGFYFLGRNFRAMGFEELAKRCYLWGVLGAVAFVTVLFLIPESLDNEIPGFLYSIVNVAIVSVYMEYYQKRMIEEQFKEGRKRFSYWWWLLISISLGLVQIPFIILYAWIWA